MSFNIPVISFSTYYEIKAVILFVVVWLPVFSYNSHLMSHAIYFSCDRAVADPRSKLILMLSLTLIMAYSYSVLVCQSSFPDIWLVGFTVF